MPQYNCLIVEDEPLAAEVIRDYIAQVPFLTLREICSDAIYAMEVLQREHIDLMFLDLHLPRLKGFDFLKSLQASPRVIVTTAYHEYALSGYEYNVLDYLLKPVEFSRFLAAVNKMVPVEKPDAKLSGMIALPERRCLFFNVNKRKIRVYLDEILYIESRREYINIYTMGAAIVTKMQLNKVEELLPAGQFIRVHRSFIVARRQIGAFTAIDVEVNGQSIPVGRSYKELVSSLLHH
jgi:DNA-binding LytR/AlgR family response regulator